MTERSDRTAAALSLLLPGKQRKIAAGRASVRADCNRCNGLADVGATSLRVGPVLACTHAFCPSAPFDDTFLRILSGESTASIEGDTLLLRADRGILRFRR